jgi:predicted Zn-dependent protease
VGDPGSDVRRFLSEGECRALASRILGYARGGGRTEVTITSAWSGELRWARNRVSLASDRRDMTLSVMRNIRGAIASASTNQMDESSLEAVTRSAERSLRYQPRLPEDMVDPPSRFEYPASTIWSDATLAVDTAARGDVSRAIVAPVEQHGLLSAGYVQVIAGSVASIDSDGRAVYAPYTQAQCSTTVRNPAGTGSGWAGASSFDWQRIDVASLGRRAEEKCLASRNPVAIEPGRYTVILEPQAVADLLQPLVFTGLDRFWAEAGGGPFSAGGGNSKLGFKVADGRVTLGHDPTDPDLGVIPFYNGWEPVRPVRWIDGGRLTSLAYDRAYALSSLQQNLALPNTRAFRLSGGETSLEEMIRTTERGLLVTRFSNLALLDQKSWLQTGLTRDGLWLVEHGKITKAATNFRFTESPLFVLNNLEQMGRPVPIFSPGTPIVVPPLKARDFSFTSLADAV